MILLLVSLLLLLSPHSWAFQPSPLALAKAKHRLRPSSSPVSLSTSASPTSFTALLASRCLVWFTEGDLRLHDHEILHECHQTGQAITPVYIFDPTFFRHRSPSTIRLTHAAIMDLRHSFQELGTDLLIHNGKAEDILPRLVDKDDEVAYFDDGDSFQRDWCERGLSSLPPTVKRRPWNVRLRPGISAGDVDYNFMKGYEPKVKGIEWTPGWPRVSRTTLPHVMLPDGWKGSELPKVEVLEQEVYGGEGEGMKAGRKLAQKESFVGPRFSSGEVPGETLALKWLNEYLDYGPGDFGNKFLDLQGEGLDKAAIRRIIEGKGLSALFEGEVFTRCFSPFLGLGCLSLRLVAQSLYQRYGHRPSSRLFKRDPEIATLERVVEQREWHRLLAESDLTLPPVPEPMDFRYWNWQGHPVRYAVGPTPADPDAPTIVLVHGFGASSDQWSKMFSKLVPLGYRVFAVDLLGFGHAEKPPLSYTQYLWQDQVRDFILEVVQSPYYIAGNSIGGFTAMSVAADDPSLCQGLILLNSAGSVLTPEKYEASVRDKGGITMEEATRVGALGPYSGPPKPVLRAASQVLFWYLQPQIGKICRDLYKKYPDEVNNRLVTNIYRDSCDPGALGVFASGARLPPPRTANELLNKFQGPVLVAQGILDPLNDARGRAKLLEGCYPATTVVEIEGGHCVHDEDPKMVAEAMHEFIQKNKPGSTGARPREVQVQKPAPAPASTAPAA